MDTVPIVSSLHVVSGLNKHPSTPQFIAIHRIYSSPNLCRLVPKRNKVSAVVNEDISGISSDPEITWQIVIGALAGVTPFVVAGIEFRKRIVEQNKCKVCKGSGLVLRDNKYYFRCPACGGFLPWQSWRRFFTG